MLQYIIRRVLQFIPLLVIISILSFTLIELPPGDYLSTYIMRLEEAGTVLAEDEIARLTRQYGLDRPAYVRYLMWMWNILRHGNFGRSFQWGKSVEDVIGDRIMLTIVISLSTLLFVWMVSIPIGIYAATHQYSILDYVFTVIGFIGMSVPSFLLALVVIYFALAYFGLSVSGLFSPEFIDEPWSWARIADLAKHIWAPIIVIGVSGTASLIRVMRGTLLDELRKPYVTTARAKGLSERKLLFKYPVRIAINPMISTIGWLLPAIISGSSVVSIVLNLPTTGPMLVQALMAQDMYLAGSFILLLSSLTILGTLISDILLAALDPRIRYGGR